MARSWVMLRQGCALWALVVWYAGVDLRNADAAADLACFTKPQVVVAVGSSVSGVLSSMAVNQGDVVKEGQVLATLESSLEEAEVEVAKGKAEMDAAVKGAQVKAEFSQRKAGRAKDLKKSAAIASTELDEAETEERIAEVAYQQAVENKRLAQLEMKRAEIALALRTVRSPIAGVVVGQYLFPGELVKQSPILQVAKLDPLGVEVFASQSWLGKISAGMLAEIRVHSSPRDAYEAKVLVIDPVVDSASSTFRVRLELSNPQYRIPAGVACSVRLRAQ